MVWFCQDLWFIIGWPSIKGGADRGSPRCAKRYSANLQTLVALPHSLTRRDLHPVQMKRVSENIFFQAVPRFYWSLIYFLSPYWTLEDWTHQPHLYTPSFLSTVRPPLCIDSPLKATGEDWVLWADWYKKDLVKCCILSSWLYLNTVHFSKKWKSPWNSNPLVWRGVNLLQPKPNSLTAATLKLNRIFSSSDPTEAFSISSRGTFVI